MSGTVLRKSSALLVIAVLLTFMPTSCKKISGEQKEPGWPEISFVPIKGRFSRPTHITHSGDGSGTLFVSEQKGRIRTIKDGAVSASPYLDISKRVSCCGERGLLGTAFPPEFSNKNYFYVNYTDRPGDTVVARYKVDTVSGTAAPESEEIILRVKQPYSNHNGGQIAFGPDGYLYIGMGDGGSGGDPQGHGQNPGSLLGKMLRIDVESGKMSYEIPVDNPFVESRDYRPEIWALGLRNPWRFSFDRETGDLYIADVGQNRYEEIHFQPASSRGGENYGWNIMEGIHCYKSNNCDTPGLIYFYGDYCSGRIWGLKKKHDGWTGSPLKDTGFNITTFGEDEKGELYVADYENKTIYRIEAK
jgi:glucose/arabinose dehydrogenase